MTRMTMIVNNLSFTATVLTRNNINHLPKRTISNYTLLTSTMTIRTCIYLRAGFCSITMTMVTSIFLSYTKFLSNTFSSFPQSDFHVIAKVSTLLRSITTLTSSTSKHIKYVFKSTTKAAKSTLTKSTKTTKSTGSRTGTTFGGLLISIMS